MYSVIVCVCYCCSVDMTRILVRLGASLSMVDIDNNTGKYLKTEKYLSKYVFKL